MLRSSGSEIFVRGVQCADAGILAGDGEAVHAYLEGKAALSRGLLLQLPSQPSGHTVFLGVGVAACLQAAMFNSAAGLAVAMQRTAGPCLPLTNALLASGSSDLFCRICPRLWWHSYFGRVQHLVAKPPT